MRFRTMTFSASVEGSGGAADPAAAAPPPTLMGSQEGAATQAGADTTSGAATQAGADTLPAADKGADTQAGQDALPTKADDYKLDMPEGMKRDDPLVAGLLESALKHKVPNAAVQGLLADLGPKVSEMLNAPIAAYQQMNADWSKAARTDTEFGGAKLDATVQRINSAVASVASGAELAAYKEALDFTGAGNHPAIIRVMARLAARLAEPGHVQGNPVPVTRNGAVLYDKSIPGAAG